jgi:hypothetical protein
MGTAWVNYLNGITTDKAIGDRVGVKLDPDPNAVVAFTTPLRPIGSNDTEPSAWFTAAPMTAFGLSVVTEFTGPGPYPKCNAIGVTNADVADGKAVMVLEFGPRAQIEGHGIAFMALHGYEVMPEQQA